MIDTESYGAVELTGKTYDRIESTVIDLYEELGVKEFPINPFEIAKRKGYVLIPYSQLDEEVLKTLLPNNDNGWSGRTKNGEYRIFYNDTHCKERQKFTIMHEIGHIVLGHRENSIYAEKCANYFATYALAPSPMIGRTGCEDFVDISNRFGISYESAIWAFDRYTRWATVSCGLKPYEIKLRRLFNNL